MAETKPRLWLLVRLYRDYEEQDATPVAAYTCAQAARQDCAAAEQELRRLNDWCEARMAEAKAKAERQQATGHDVEWDDFWDPDRPFPPRCRPTIDRTIRPADVLRAGSTTYGVWRISEVDPHLTRAREARHG